MRNDLKYGTKAGRPPMCPPPNRSRSQFGGSNIACITFDGLLVVPSLPTQTLVCGDVEVDERDRTGLETRSIPSLCVLIAHPLRR